MERVQVDIVSEFSTVLRRVQNKESLQVVSKRQSTVLCQIRVLEESLHCPRQSLLLKLGEIRSYLETLMVESAKKQYKDVWHRFHALSVDKLPAIWNEIGSSMGFNMEPILHQGLSQMWLTRLLPNQRPPLATSSDVDSRELSAEEEKAIMYTGGFIVRKLRCKYEKINTKTAAEYVEVMTSLLQGGKFDDGEIVINDCIQSWITDIDRGGLSVLNPKAYEFFEYLERLVYSFLLGVIDEEHITDAIVMRVVSDDHLLFLWSMLSIDILKNEDSDALLSELSALWLKVRGHSITSQVVEIYKKHKQKNMKGTKGIRKQLKLDLQSSTEKTSQGAGVQSQKSAEQREELMDDL